MKETEKGTITQGLESDLNKTAFIFRIDSTVRGPYIYALAVPQTKWVHSPIDIDGPNSEIQWEIINTFSSILAAERTARANGKEFVAVVKNWRSARQ